MFDIAIYMNNILEQDIRVTKRYKDITHYTHCSKQERKIIDCNTTTLQAYNKLTSEDRAGLPRRKQGYSEKFGTGLWCRKYKKIQEANKKEKKKQKGIIRKLYKEKGIL